MAIIFDTETTGLIDNSLLPLKMQPHIIELFAVKIDNLFTAGEWIETDRLNLLIHPGQPVSEEITKITGITNDMLAGKPTWAAVQDQVRDFFWGEKRMVAHNLSYDRDMLAYELKRTDSLLKFPWPSEHICTVEATEHLEGMRLNLGALHQRLFGVSFAGAHRAEADVLALADCYKELVKTGVIPE